MRRVALFLLLTSLLANGGFSWKNNYDQPLDFKCPAGQSISYIKSKHDNNVEDRLWDFGCKNTFYTRSDCFLSPYVNNFDEAFTYECPPHHVIAGMSSYHYNKAEDRRWQFYCCRSNSYCTTACAWTPYVNWFDELFHWSTPNYNYLVGAGSYHDNNSEDRRWYYKYCAIVQC